MKIFVSYSMLSLLGLLLLSSFALAAENPTIVEARLSTYQVPVEDSALLPYATYTKSSDNPNDEISPKSIVFWLPDELLGARHPFFYLLPQQDGSWAGAGVHGSCRFADPDLICDVQFDPALASSIDLGEVRKTLQNENLKPSLVNAKASVSAAFAGELHGVITEHVPEEQRASFRVIFNH